MNRKQLLPGYVTKRLPSLDATAEQSIAESTIHVKFFYPDFGWTWYGIAYDGDDLFFGLVDGVEAELGYFRLSELMANRGKLGCPIERDRFFTPQPLEPLYNKLTERGGAHEERITNDL